MPTCHLRGRARRAGSWFERAFRTTPRTRCRTRPSRRRSTASVGSPSASCSPGPRPWPRRRLPRRWSPRSWASVPHVAFSGARGSPRSMPPGVTKAAALERWAGAPRRRTGCGLGLRRHAQRPADARVGGGGVGCRQRPSRGRAGWPTACAGRNAADGVCGWRWSIWCSPLEQMVRAPAFERVAVRAVKDDIISILAGCLHRPSASARNKRWSGRELVGLADRLRSPSSWHAAGLVSVSCARPAASTRPARAVLVTDLPLPPRGGDRARHRLTACAAASTLASTSSGERRSRDRGRAARDGASCRSSWATRRPTSGAVSSVLRDEVPAGQVTSAAWGATLGSGVGLALVGDRATGTATVDWVREGSYEVDLAGVAQPGRGRPAVALRPRRPEALTRWAALNGSFADH